jgi:carotenoid 1,2-hydratase
VNATGGYRWWYFDALSDDGTRGLTAILFIGSVFSPSYARRLRRGEAALPDEHVAVNLALYDRKSPRAWVMSEYGRSALHGVSDAGPVIAESAIEALPGGALRLVLRDRSAPFLASLAGVGARVEGTLELEPLCGKMPQVPLDAAGVHRWRVAVPRGRVKVRFTRPDFSFDGIGYHDLNEGDGRLETAFARWSWARFHADDRTIVLYSARERSGAARALLLDTRDGDADEERRALTVAPGPEGESRKVGWGLPMSSWFSVERPGGGVLRCTPSDFLQVAPFYARYAAALDEGDRPLARGMGEYLDLDRFASRGLQFLLRFKTRRV